MRSFFMRSSDKTKRAKSTNDLEIKKSTLLKYDLGSGNIYGHVIFFAQSKSGVPLFLKECYQGENPTYEVCASQLYRLFLGKNQPNVTYTKLEGKTFIVQERLQNYKNVTDLDTLTDTQNYELGRLLIASVFLDEADLKYDSVVVNDKGHVVKIDNDDSLQKHLKKYDYNKDPIIRTFNTDTLNYPLDRGYKVVPSWYVFKGESSAHRKDDLHSNEYFKKGVFFQISKILLMESGISMTVARSIIKNNNFLNIFSLLLKTHEVYVIFSLFVKIETSFLNDSINI